MRGDHTHTSQNNWDNGNWHIIHLMEICCQGTIFSSSLVTTLMSAGQKSQQKIFLAGENHKVQCQDDYWDG